MRHALESVLKSVGVPDHLTLAYDAWAPIDDDGKVPEEDNARSRWLTQLAGIGAPRDYSRSYERWKESFSGSGDRVFELELASRLLVGHGNSSATGIGLTVHHTWGVPVIPGSALKGLAAHYVDAVYGPSDPERMPWEQDGDERARADYQGSFRHGSRIRRGPGTAYRALFGAPDAEEDDAMRARGLDAGASAGHVIFHDALYVPMSVKDDKPFAADVITVHQKRYYDSSGGSWPNDFDDPTPIAFLTVRPGVRLLLALSGPTECTALAEHILREALEQWGVGGKTSAGYGRLICPRRNADDDLREAAARASQVRPAPRPGDVVEAVLLEERTKKGGWKARHEPSGLEGPIQNSAAVPSDRRSGDRVSLIVKIAKGRESGFEWPSEKSPARSGDRRRKR